MGRLIGYATSPRPLLDSVSPGSDGLGWRSHCRWPGLLSVLLPLRSRMRTLNGCAEHRSNRLDLRFAESGFKRQSHGDRRLNPHHDGQRSHSFEQPSSCFKSAEHAFSLLLAQLRSRRQPSSDDGRGRDQQFVCQSLASAGRSDRVDRVRIPRLQESGRRRQNGCVLDERRRLRSLIPDEVVRTHRDASGYDHEKQPASSSPRPA
jgi:hypothetical protein